jgi:hypothetical protein
MSLLSTRRFGARAEVGPGRRASLLGAAAVNLFLLGIACGSSDERPAPPPTSDDLPVTDLSQYDRSTADARDVYSAGHCTEGATKQCRVYLTAHDGIQPCFVGAQTCVGARWGNCENAVLVDANSNDSRITPGSASP